MRVRLTEPEPSVATWHKVHDWLRGELARIRDEIGTDNRGDANQLTPLRAYCIAFCEALTHHHTSEDTVAFPTLARQLPELAPVLEQLSQDHQLVEGILGQLRELLTTVTARTIEPVRRGNRWTERNPVVVAAAPTTAAGIGFDEVRLHSALHGQ